MGHDRQVSAMRSPSQIACDQVGVGPTGPSLPRVLGIVLVSYAIFFVALFLFSGSWSLVGGDTGDNPAYLKAASAIRHWQFSGVVVKQFWGLSYAVAGLSTLTRMPERTSLVVVCIGASLVSVTLCYCLWDSWVALFFALLSFEWLQRSLLGGAEPLFMALLLGSFLALRRQKWEWAAVLGGFATVVRPFGVFALIGLGVQLLWRRQFWRCAVATLTGLVIGALYVWPFEHYWGSPFANVVLYQRNDWHGGLPFTFPLVAILRGTFPINAPLTNLALTWGWILLVLLGLIVGIRSGEFRRYAAEHTAEAWFVLLYAVALYSYDAPGWSRSNFPRFAIPLLPWILAFLVRFLPKNQKVIWGLAVISATLAAASAVGIHHGFGTLLRSFR